MEAERKKTLDERINECVIGLILPSSLGCPRYCPLIKTSETSEKLCPYQGEPCFEMYSAWARSASANEPTYRCNKR